MLDKVKSNNALQPVRVVQRSDGGADVWLRKNIKGPLTEMDSVEGLSCTYYEADEAFIRLAYSVSEEEVQAVFDSYWEQAAEYDPHMPPLTERERIKRLEEQQVSLQEQSTMLTECLLEMSEIVYA